MSGGRGLDFFDTKRFPPTHARSLARFSLGICVGSKRSVSRKSKPRPHDIIINYIIKSTRPSCFLLDKIYSRIIFAGEREGLGMRLHNK